jgi:hypothetical protein
MQPVLIIESLCAEAAKFAGIESEYNEPTLYGVTEWCDRWESSRNLS